MTIAKETQKLKILIADDEKKIHSLLAEHLSTRYEVLTATDGKSALDILLREKIEIILLDIKMPGMDGMKLLRQIYDRKIRTITIMISGHGTIQNAIESIRLGAFEYIEKPFKAETVFAAIERAIANKQLREKPRTAKSLDLIVGKSKEVCELKDKIKWIAPSDGRVLITGESGTGKEIVASAIHALSQRNKEPFVPSHCAAIPEELFESELFGYKKGAFTGAYADKKGLFESADNGTVFLDEIGELPLHSQVKLLRVLETGKIQRIGDNVEREFDARVICATNKDLEQEVKKGNFRNDLYFRFNVIEIYLCPLRERIEDIPVLIEHFMQEFCAENKLKSFSQDALSYLKEYSWPGNIRELKNVVERMVLIPTDGIITKSALLKNWNPAKLSPSNLSESDTQKHQTFHEAKKAFEKDFILNALDKQNGKVSKTATELGLNRSWLYRKMKELDIELEQFD